MTTRASLSRTFARQTSIDGACAASKNSMDRQASPISRMASSTVSRSDVRSLNVLQTKTVGMAFAPQQLRVGAHLLRFMILTDIEERSKIAEPQGCDGGTAGLSGGSSPLQPASDQVC